VFKIGNIELGTHALFLAPMEDVTDPSFRYICKLFGADVVYTEFISSDGLIRNGAKSVKKLDIFDYERPIGIQLYGHLIDPMVEAAKIAESSFPEFIDINFGCPVRKIANRGAGAGMLRNIPLMVEMAKAIVNSTNIPVTVKTRLGWDEDNKNILEITKQLQDVGVKAITIHGRTRNQMYKGKSDWTLIGEVKNHPGVHIPVIGNGDINGPEVAKEMFETHGVDGIMIGRASMGRPWIFKEIKHYLETGEKLAPLSINEKVKLAKLHFQKSLDWKSEPRGIFEMRRHFSNYFKGLPNFKETRIKLLTSLDSKEIFSILESIVENYNNIDLPDIPSQWYPDQA